MKLAKTLLLIGGIANALFFLFHCWLGWQLHGWAALPPAARVLMEMLNGGGAGLVLLLAVASFACTADMLTTRLGHCVLAATAALYGLRGVAEIFLAPRIQPAVVAACLAVSTLYVAVLVCARRALAPAAAPTAASAIGRPILSS